nr:IclR family transcriptional regulator [Martelella limonii]
MVLEALAQAGSPVTPTEVNQTLGLPKPTIHRLFATLEAEGFIQREIDGRGYSPGSRLRVMSAGIMSSLRIRTARQAILTALAEEINETCNISIPDRDAMIYLERVETKWPLRIQLPVGSRVPFYCTSAGKMYLSSLDRKHVIGYLNATELTARAANTMTTPEALLEEIDRIRERGYSTDNEEFMDGMIAVAVPIRDSYGRLVSSLSFHAPLQRLTLEEAVGHVGLLNGASGKLSALISDPEA